MSRRSRSDLAGASHWAREIWRSSHRCPLEYLHGPGNTRPGPSVRLVRQDSAEQRRERT